jgi:hypothetical protein
LKILVFAAAAAAAPVGCKDCRDSDESKGREGKGRGVNLGSSEERVRDPWKEMTIRFVLLVNKQGQTRLAQYYEYLTIDERRALEGEIVRKCLARSENQVSEAKIWFFCGRFFCGLDGAVSVWKFCVLNSYSIKREFKTEI